MSRRRPPAPGTLAALWSQYHAYAFAFFAAFLLVLPPGWVRWAVENAQHNGPLLVQLAGIYFAFKAAMSRAPHDARADAAEGRQIMEAVRTESVRVEATGGAP